MNTIIQTAILAFAIGNTYGGSKAICTFFDELFDPLYSGHRHVAELFMLGFFAMLWICSLIYSAVVVFRSVSQ